MTTNTNTHLKVTNKIRSINTNTVEFEVGDDLVFLARKSSFLKNPIWKICADGIYVLDVYANSYGLTAASY